MKITARMLRDYCDDSDYWGHDEPKVLEEHWPDGVEVNEENLTRLQEEFGFALSDLAHAIMDEDTLERFETRADRAHAEYIEAVQVAQKRFDEVRGSTPRPEDPYIGAYLRDSRAREQEVWRIMKELTNLRRDVLRPIIRCHFEPDRPEPTGFVDEETHIKEAFETLESVVPGLFRKIGSIWARRCDERETEHYKKLRAAHTLIYREYNRAIRRAEKKYSKTTRGAFIEEAR